MTYKNNMVMKVNFDEWVELVFGSQDITVNPAIGPRISDNSPWHSVLDGAKNAAGDLAPDTVFANDIAPGHVPIGDQP